MNTRVSFIALLIALPLAFAEDASTVKAYGAGSVSVTPDQAIVSIGVITQADSAEGASAESAKRLSAVLDQLRNILGAKAELRTSGYSLTPNYKTANVNAPEISGYTVRNTVQAKVDDLSKLGAVIDGGTKAGANSITGIQFSLKNDQAAVAAALKQAAHAARANAEAIAATLGFKVIRIRSAETTEAGRFGPLPQSEMRPMMAKIPPTIVEPGIEFHAMVTVIAEVGR